MLVETTDNDDSISGNFESTLASSLTAQLEEVANGRIRWMDGSLSSRWCVVAVDSTRLSQFTVSPLADRWTIKF